MFFSSLLSSLFILFHLLSSLFISFHLFHPLSLSTLSFYHVSSVVSSPRLPHPLYHALFSSIETYTNDIRGQVPTLDDKDQTIIYENLFVLESNPMLKDNIAQTGTTFFAREITRAKKEFAKTNLDATSHFKKEHHQGCTFPGNALTSVHLTLLWC